MRTAKDWKVSSARGRIRNRRVPLGLKAILVSLPESSEGHGGWGAEATETVWQAERVGCLRHIHALPPEKRWRGV